MILLLNDFEYFTLIQKKSSISKNISMTSFFIKGEDVIVIEYKPQSKCNDKCNVEDPYLYMFINIYIYIYKYIYIYIYIFLDLLATTKVLLF